MSSITTPRPTSPTPVGAPSPDQPTPETAPQQARQWMDAGEAVLVDVREPDEHAREHIAGAHLIPLSRFDPHRAAALLRPGQRLIMHCRSGKRSAEAARLAGAIAESGIPVVCLAGGLEAWKAQGLPVQTNTSVARLSIMRQFQLTVGVGLLLGSALAWLVSPWFLIIPAFFGAGLTFAGATGTCGLTSLLAIMPWNKAAAAAGSCAAGSCG